MQLTNEQNNAVAREFANRIGGWLVRKNDVPFIAFVRALFTGLRAVGVKVPAGEDFDRTLHGIGLWLIIGDNPDPVGVAHEGEHVGQFKDKDVHEGLALEGTLSFAWLYATNTLARIRFEMRAFRAGYEVAKALGREIPTPDALVQTLFENYALEDTKPNRDFAKTLAAAMLHSVESGVVTTEAGHQMLTVLRSQGILPGSSR